jgi:hypothetical protein
MMTNVAKNIYALRSYKPIAKKVYEKGNTNPVSKLGFTRVKAESERFWAEANKIIETSDAYADKVKGTKPGEIVAKFHDGAKKGQEAAAKR